MGNRAHIIMDPKSTISRLNVGRLYERNVKAAMVVLEHLVRDEYKSYNVSEPYELTDSQLVSLFSHPKDFVTIIGNKLSDYYNYIIKNHDREAMISIIEEIIKDRFRIYLTMDDDKRKYEIVGDLANSIYKPVYDKITYVYNGENRVSKNNIMIAPMYMFQLNKIADAVLTASSAKLNHFGIPVVTSKADRYSLPSKNSPVRTQGETEGRIFAAYGGREFLAELKDLNTSIESHSTAYETILTTKTPTDIPRVIDRKLLPYGSERGLTILNSLWNSIGMELEYVKEDKTFYPYKESKTTDIIDINEVGDLDAMGLTGGKDED